MNSAGLLEPITTTSALSCENVRVSFHDHKVLCDITLKLRQGEWLSIIGPNGAGKSTLLRSIVGLTKYLGTVTLGDGRVPRAADVALVPQFPVLPKGMTVAEYVLLGRTAHLGWLARESQVDRKIVSSVLNRLELAGFAERFVSTLSGGETQQVVIARALAQQCPVLLLDEPTSALDVGHQVSVLELMDDLRRTEGLSVLAAMHDLSAAGRFADRLILIDHGQIVAQGNPVDVLKPDLLSDVYGTPLTVQSIHGELMVLPATRQRAQTL
ncbi:MAG: ABC transporter ATP-binding protein [Acidimicrobiia bacterium]|nr:ABC transporter ATP-binding protein [Acidimicrobiia bacterium]MYC57933.1 ABC transporter ATP-binding protein [Acidimicrobiia bacterium]MYI31236.1 ABC transporter ATP-binding protein [Acidimicrobiia bacterium]